MNHFGVTIMGDSIIRHRKGKIIFDWSEIVKKNLKTKVKKKVFFKTKIIHGLNSRGLINLIPNFFHRINSKFKDLLIVQIGINDSWHYLSLKGMANVPKENFLKNLKEIYKKSKIYNFKKICFLNYHKILLHRIEGNNKTPNQNLKEYNNIIKKFCEAQKISLINIEKKTNSIKNICLNLPDGVHLNKKGVKAYSKIIVKFLIKEINEKN